MAGNYPRIPGITPGLGLVHDPLLPAACPLALPVGSGRLTPRPRGNLGRATNNMSQFRWRHTRRRRVLLKRPAGLLIAVDDPVGRSHRPRAHALSCQQRYEVRFDGPIQFAFANPLHLPIPEPRHAVCRCSGFFVSFPTCGRSRVGHSGDRRFGRGWARPTVMPSAS